MVSLRQNSDRLGAAKRAHVVETRRRQVNAQHANKGGKRDLQVAILGPKGVQGLVRSVTCERHFSERSHDCVRFKPR